MSIRMVRAKVKAEKTAELEKAAKEMFAAIEAAPPQGVRYASCKLPDDETFVILLELDDDEDNPLLAVPAFREFQATPAELDRRAAGRGATDARRLVPALLTGPRRAAVRL